MKSLCFAFLGIILVSLPCYPEQRDDIVDAFCNRLLSDQASELRISKAEAQQNMQVYMNHFGLNSLPHVGDGLLSSMGIDPAKHSQIVLLSLNNFFGDSMIFHFSIIDFFRKKYPNIPLTVISPNAVVLSRPDSLDFKWEVFPVRFPTFRKREDRVDQIVLMRQRLPRFLKTHIQPGAFVFYDLTTCDKADEELVRLKPEEKLASNEIRHVSHRLGATAVGLSTLHKERIFNGVTGVEIIAPQEQLPKSDALIPYRADSQRWAGATGFEFRNPVTFNAETVYQSWLQNFALLFGSDAYLRWDHRHFVDPFADSAVIKAFLQENQMDASREHVVINLNTFGGDKVRDLTPVYAETLKKIVLHVRKTHPAVNILVTFPETQFGPNVQTEILDFVQSLKPFVALVPSSYREIMPAFVATSKWLISYDSGLVHLASFLPADRVLSLALSSGGAEFWRRPGQSYIKLQEGEDPGKLASGAIHWIDSLYTAESPR